MHSPSSRQAKAGQGFDLAHFHVDWQAEQAICPQGQTSQRWSTSRDRIEVVFAQQVCAGCPCRADCTQSLTRGRVLHLRPQAAHEALQSRRQEQQTQEFRKQYALRAGIEGTLSQGVRRMGLRQARYDGLPKVHLQHVLIAVAINLVRIDAVLTQTPRGKTRRSSFARLASHAELQEAVGT
jgi:transposase